MRLPDRLETPRLVLRRPDPEDAPRVGEAIQESLDDLAPWFKWARLLQRYGDLEDMGARAVSGATRFESGDNPVYFVWCEDRFLGEIDIDNPHFRTHRALELEIWMRSGSRGRGFGTEAARAVLGYLFDEEGCAFVEARIAAENGPSRRLFSRLGFQPHGLRDDHDRYLLTAEDWRWSRASAR